MEVNIKSTDVNDFLKNTILESAIGDTLKSIVKEHVTKLTSSYNNPLVKVVEAEINKYLWQILQNEFAEVMKAKIRELLTDKLVSNVVEAAFEKFLDKNKVKNY